MPRSAATMPSGDSPRKRPKKKKRGRPPLPASERRDHDIKVPVTDAEHQLIARAAGETPIAVWLRDLAIASARIVTE